MTALKMYLLSVCAAALLLSVVTAALPKNKVRNIALLCGTILLVITVVAPISSIDPSDMSRSIMRFKMDTAQMQSGIEVKNHELLCEIIKDECQEYIMEKARSIGVNITAEIELDETGEYPYPISVKLHGDITTENQSYLERIIEQELGIVSQDQEWE